MVNPIIPERPPLPVPELSGMPAGFGQLSPSFTTGFPSGAAARKLSPYTPTGQDFEMARMFMGNSNPITQATESMGTRMPATTPATPTRSRGRGRSGALSNVAPPGLTVADLIRYGSTPAGAEAIRMIVNQVRNRQGIM